MISKTTPGFWDRYNALPLEVQKLADRCYSAWLQNTQHPSLRFKSLRGPLHSARIGAHYRAIGHLKEGIMTWVWIGTHEEYNNFRF